MSNFISPELNVLPYDEVMSLLNPEIHNLKSNTNIICASTKSADATERKLRSVDGVLGVYDTPDGLFISAKVLLGNLKRATGIDLLFKEDLSPKVTQAIRVISHALHLLRIQKINTAVLSPAQNLLLNRFDPKVQEELQTKQARYIKHKNLRHIRRIADNVTNDYGFLRFKLNENTILLKTDILGSINDRRHQAAEYCDRMQAGKFFIPGWCLFNRIKEKLSCPATLAIWNGLLLLGHAMIDDESTS